MSCGGDLAAELARRIRGGPVPPIRAEILPLDRAVQPTAPTKKARPTTTPAGRATSARSSREAPGLKGASRADGCWNGSEPRLCVVPDARLGGSRRSTLRSRYVAVVPNQPALQRRNGGHRRIELADMGSAQPTDSWSARSRHQSAPAKENQQDTNQPMTMCFCFSPFHAGVNRTARARHDSVISDSRGVGQTYFRQSGGTARFFSRQRARRINQRNNPAKCGQLTRV